MGARLGSVLVGVREALLDDPVRDELGRRPGSGDVALDPDRHGEPRLLELADQLVESRQPGCGEIVARALVIVRPQHLEERRRSRRAPCARRCGSCGRASCAVSGRDSIAEDATPALRLMTAIWCATASCRSRAIRSRSSDTRRRASDSLVSSARSRALGDRGDVLAARAAPSPAAAANATVTATGRPAGRAGSLSDGEHVDQRRSTPIVTSAVISGRPPAQPVARRRTSRSRSPGRSRASSDPVNAATPYSATHAASTGDRPAGGAAAGRAPAPARARRERVARAGTRLREGDEGRRDDEARRRRRRRSTRGTRGCQPRRAAQPVASRRHPTSVAAAAATRHPPRAACGVPRSQYPKCPPQDDACRGRANGDAGSSHSTANQEHP